MIHPITPITYPSVSNDYLANKAHSPILQKALRTLDFTERKRRRAEKSAAERLAVAEEVVRTEAYLRTEGNGDDDDGDSFLIEFS